MKNLYKSSGYKQVYCNGMYKYIPSTGKVDEDKRPYIQIQQDITTFDISDNVILNIKVTDWFHSEKRYVDLQREFDLIITIDNTSKINIKRNIGENSIDIGKLPEGQHSYVVQAIDMFGRESHQIYNEFRVIDKAKRDKIINENTYLITEQDLVTYNITLGDFTERIDANISIGLNNKFGLQNLMDNKKVDGIRKMLLPKNCTITIEVEGKWVQPALQHTKNVLSIPSEFILDLNGSKINKVTASPDFKVGFMMAIVDCYDSHIQNGTLAGDYGRREFIRTTNSQTGEKDNYVPGEQDACCMIGGDSKYCSMNNIRVEQFAGYTLVSGVGTPGLLGDRVYKNSIVDNQNLTYEFTEIDKTGTELPSDKWKTSNMLSLALFNNIGRFRLTQYLGVLYSPHGNSIVGKYHFYNNEGEYLTTSIGHTYRDVVIPANSTHVRVSLLYNKNSTDTRKLSLIFMNSPRNCEWRNVYCYDTRTCAFAPYQGNNLLIDECTIDKCAAVRFCEGGEVTPCAIDFEDGWHNMQDYIIQNSTVVNPVGTAEAVVVGGFDLTIRCNKGGWRISQRGFTRGTRVTDNELIYGQFFLTSHIFSAFTVIERNLFLKESPVIGQMTDDNFLCIQDCVFRKNSTVTSSADGRRIVRNNEYYFDNSIPSVRGAVLSGLYHNCKFYGFVNSGDNDTICIVQNFEAHDCYIDSMRLTISNGCFKLYNCIVDNTLTLNNYNVLMHIEVDSTTISNFYINKFDTFTPDIFINIKNSIITNTSNDRAILHNKYKNFYGMKFKIATKNNVYNNTTIADEQTLLNTNIDFSDMK